MSEHLRNLVAGLKKSVNRIANPEQRQIELPVEVALEKPPQTGNALLHGNSKPLLVTGKTQNLSKNKISFVVPFIRIGEEYLVSHGAQKRLKLVFELPTGTVRMTVAPANFEMIMLHDSMQQYLIGAEIVEISEGDQERYQSFLNINGNAAETNSQSNFGAETKKSLVSNFFSLF